MRTSGILLSVCFALMAASPVWSEPPENHHGVALFAGITDDDQETSFSVGIEIVWLFRTVIIEIEPMTMKLEEEQ